MKCSIQIAGMITGLISGLFGGGGGMVLLPMLRRETDLSSHALFANCVAIIFPVCIVSSLAYLLGSAVDLRLAMPFLLGGSLGGFIGGRIFHSMPPKILYLAFAAFLFYAGAKYLL
ncbi:MAG: TSUP family transporter [Oscillospiraceae bacterium]|nr:TSUP family transporter [Oscillospiraceae bacterium]